MDRTLEPAATGRPGESRGFRRGAPTILFTVCREPLTSIDYKANPLSSIVDAPSTMVIGGNLAKVVSWYDNEYAYSCRVADLANYIASKGL